MKVTEIQIFHCTKNKVFHYESLYESQFTADLVTFTEEILNGKLYFLSHVCYLPHGGILRC